MSFIDFDIVNGLLLENENAKTSHLEASDINQSINKTVNDKSNMFVNAAKQRGVLNSSTVYQPKINTTK